MHKIFNFFLDKMSRFADLFILNIIFIITCIPVITCGAAITALYRITLQMVRGEEGYIVRDYLKEFKASFKTITPTWLVFLVIGAVMIADEYLLNKIDALSAFKLLAVLIGAGIIVYMMILCYLFPLTAYYENTRLNTVKNAFLLAISRMPVTLVMMAANFIPVLLMIWSPVFLIYGILIWGVCGFALIALINSFFLRRVFDRLQ